MSLKKIIDGEVVENTEKAEEKGNQDDVAAALFE